MKELRASFFISHAWTDFFFKNQQFGKSVNPIQTSRLKPGRQIIPKSLVLTSPGFKELEIVMNKRLQMTDSENTFFKVAREFKVEQNSNTYGKLIASCLKS